MKTVSVIIPIYIAPFDKQKEQFLYSLELSIREFLTNFITQIILVEQIHTPQNFQKSSLVQKLINTKFHKHKDKIHYLCVDSNISIIQQSKLINEGVKHSNDEYIWIHVPVLYLPFRKIIEQLNNKKAQSSHTILSHFFGRYSIA